MKFNNRPNELIETTDGRKLWVSRSVAVAVCVVLVHEDKPHILINQRGPGVPDYQGYWNMPCGYLDFDETTEEAAIREVWEECGVNLRSLLEDAHVEYFSEPWSVASGLGNPKQNVTVHHGLVAQVESLPETTHVYNEPNETSDIRWIQVPEVNDFKFAFNHDARIHRFLAHVKQRHPHVKI